MIQPHPGNDSEKAGNLKFFRSDLMQNFRTAAKGQGEYCPIKNELRICRGNKIYRFTCRGEDGLCFTPPDEPEIVIALSADATVRELKLGIPYIIDSHEAKRKNVIVCSNLDSQ